MSRGITRRNLMRGLGAGLAFAVAPRIWADEPPAGGNTRRWPNIVFILFDDMGYGEPPCYRAGSEFKTPNLDQLAREGMRFTDAHSASAVCTPTRYGVLTGRYPWRIGQYGVLTTFSGPIIERRRLTVGSLLQNSGYHTACFGKWHLGMNWPAAVVKRGSSDSAPVGTIAADGPTSRGFDYFCGYTHARNMGMIIEQDRVVANINDIEVEPMMVGKIVAHIDRRAKAGGPFFLYVPMCPPHKPIAPAADFQGKTDAGGYGDWIYQGDWAVGQVMAALNRNKLAGNTLLIVASDNGAAGRVYPPLRGAKASIYEGGHRVPLVARWPGKVAPGSVCDDTICLNDLLATCADIIGAKLPDNAGEDSVSILPDLLGTAKAPVREATIHQSLSGDRALRQGPWKLIFFKRRAKGEDAATQKKGSRRELYNLKDDPGETRDLAAEQPAVVQRLEKLMQQYIAAGRSTPGADQENTTGVWLDSRSNKQKSKGKQKAPAEAKQEQANAMDVTFD